MIVFISALEDRKAGDAQGIDNGGKEDRRGFVDVFFRDGTDAPGQSRPDKSSL